MYFFIYRVRRATFTRARQVIGETLLHLHKQFTYDTRVEVISVIIFYLCARANSNKYKSTITRNKILENHME